MSDIIKTQRSLAIKAKHNPTHKFDHLYRVICQQEWIRTALEAVLSNKGAHTSGIDGVTKRALASEEARATFVMQLQAELREKKFRPVPVRRIYIPKSNGGGRGKAGKTRPLGIPVLKDRVVQMLLKMVLEPIWESDFLNCSNGFRPGRRTMDCIALLDSYINNRSKYYWVIEGDIRAAFDSINHEILLKLMADRVVDRRILDMVDRFLKAGLMEGGLFKHTEIGTPQGAICSPLLANIFLHQLDLYWWKKYGSLHPKVKEKRRIEHKGNCALIRYADDWLLLTNGSKEEAYRLRDEFQAFLKEELKLELSVEKTHVTHVNDGFDFLGFHVRRYVSRDDRPKMLVTPSDKTQARLKAKVKEMTARKRFKDSPLLKFSALNSVLRGWISYYRHANAKETAKDLDFWVNKRMFWWLAKRHKLPIRRVLALYKQRQQRRNGNRKLERSNCGIRNGEEWLYLYRMSDQPITKYRSKKLPNPYITGDWAWAVGEGAVKTDNTATPNTKAATATATATVTVTATATVTELEQPQTPLPEHVWLGNAENNEKVRELKEEIKAERGARCERCGSVVNLDLHHCKARRYGGKTTKENAQLLCERCHVQTPTYGDHRRLQ